MRATLTLCGVLIAGAAFAATLPAKTIDEALAPGGLIVIDMSRDDACPATEEGWTAPAARQALKDERIRPASVRFDRANADRLVGDAYIARSMSFAFRDGVEIDRLCGCMAEEPLAAWVHGIAEGRTLADAKRDELEAHEGRDFPVGGWLELVQLHDCADRPEDAFGVLAWLWSVIPQKAPEQRGIRLTRVAHDMGVIAMKHEPAREALSGMRDALTADKDSDLAANDEWVALNRILREDDKTLAWFRSHVGDPTMTELIEHQAPNAFYMIAEQGEWAEAGALIGDVSEWLEIWTSQTGGLEPATWGYAALIAADRLGDAKKLAKEALKVSPEGTACRFLQQSVDAGFTHASQKPVAKACEQADVVTAWEATL